MQLKTSYTDIWKVAYPVTIGGISQAVINTTDTIFLGRVGEVELGASAIGGVFYLVLFMIGHGFSNGIQILIARKSGEKKEEEIGDIMTHGVYIFSALSVLLFIVLFFLSRPLLAFMIRDPLILEATSIFIEYRSLGIFFVMACILFRAFYVGIGETKSIAWVMVWMSVVNIILNYLLVFGKFGFPEMGIAGSGLASSIAEFSGALYFVFLIFYRGKAQSMRLFRFGTYMRGLLDSILNLSFPIVLQSFLSIAAWLVFFLIIEKTGERNLAVSNIARSVLFVLMTPVWGFFAASTSMTSNIIGQGRSDEVFPLLKRITVLSLSFSGSLALLIFIFPMPILYSFTANESLVHASVNALYMVCGATLVFSVSSIFLGGVMGTGSTKEALWIEIITIVLYLSYLFNLAFLFDVSIEILWTSEIFYWVIAGLLSWIFLLRNTWRLKKI